MIGGPNSEFTKAEKAHRGAHARTHAYFHPTVEIYRSMCKLQCEVPLLGNKEKPSLSNDDFGKVYELVSLSNDVCVCRKQLKYVRKFEEIGNAGHRLLIDVLIVGIVLSVKDHQVGRY